MEPVYLDHNVTTPVDPTGAMGIPLAQGQAAIRFSIGRTTTKAQIDYVLETLPPIIERLRAMSPAYRQSTS